MSAEKWRCFARPGTSTISGEMVEPRKAEERRRGTASAQCTALMPFSISSCFLRGFFPRSACDQVWRPDRMTGGGHCRRISAPHRMLADREDTRLGAIGGERGQDRRRVVRATGIVESAPPRRLQESCCLKCSNPKPGRRWYRSRLCGKRRARRTLLMRARATGRRAGGGGAEMDPVVSAMAGMRCGARPAWAGVAGVTPEPRRPWRPGRWGDVGPHTKNTTAEPARSAPKPITLKIPETQCYPSGQVPPRPCRTNFPEEGESAVTKVLKN